MIGDAIHLLFQKQKPSQNMRVKAQAAGGFTIVETLIVLAITGVLFVSVIAVISGKQNKTRFTQAANAIQTEIEQVISEVQSGYSPDTGNFTCAADLVARPNQGSNSKCISLGKAMEFTGDKYSVYSLAGNKFSTSSPGLLAQSFADTYPMVRDNATINKGLLYGLTAEWTRLNGSNIGSVAFVPYFSGDSDGMVFGTQNTQVVPINGPGAAGINADIVNGYNNRRNPDSGIQVCFRSGGTEQSALITIGGLKRMNSVRLEIKNTIDCS